MGGAETGSEKRRVPVSVWLLLIAGLLSLGFSAILIRYTVPEPGVVVAFWRIALVVLLTAPVLWIRERKGLARLQQGDWLRILFAGVLLGLHFVLWVQSLHHTSVAGASVLVASSPLFIAVLGWVFLREKPSRRVVASIVVAMVGAVLIAGADVGENVLHPDASLGNGLALSAALFFSIYILIGRAVRQRIGFLPYFVPLNVVAAATALVGCLIQGVDVGVSLPVFGLCVLIALGPGLLGHGSLIVAVRYLPAAVVGLLMLLEPMMAGVLGWALFEELPSVQALVGMVLILCSVAVVVVKRARPGAGSASEGAR